jgi:hypothetical protein
MGYAHVRTGVRLDNSGCLTFIDAKGKDVLGEGREVADVVLVSSLRIPSVLRHQHHQHHHQHVGELAACW